MLPNLYLFFIVAVSIIGESSGRNCYSCSSTPSDYDNDCYRGHANASTTTCNLGDNLCLARVVNNFDGSFNVTRNCDSASISSKAVPWGAYTLSCNQDLCNDFIPHLEIPDVKCYLCTSTLANFNERCYYGQSNVLTTTCEGSCSAIFVNNFDGTFNITRGCYSYDQRNLNKRVWSKYTQICGGDFCNNVTPHLKLISSTPSSNPSSTPSSKASISNGGLCAWLFLGATFIIRVITANIFSIN